MENPEKRCIARMIYAEMEHPEVQELVRSIREDHLAPWQTVVARSIERGELPAGSDTRLIVDVLLGTVTSGMIRFQRGLDRPYLKSVVDLVVAGAKAGGAICATKTRGAARRPSTR